MNLPKMMAAAGIGCGKDCRCAKAFTDSLDESQKAIFGHMIEVGAKKRLKKIKRAGKRDVDVRQEESRQTSRGPSFPSFMDQLFEDAFAPKRQEGLNPFATMMRAMMRENAVEPYTGDLTEDQTATLNEVSPELRSRLEEGLRKVIALKGGNDPSRINLKTVEDGSDVHYSVVPDPENETTGSSDFMTMLMEALRGRQVDTSAEPFAGDLTSNQLETLAAVNESLRDKAEAEVRQVIAAEAAGDPRRVQLKLSQRGNGTVITALVLDPIAAAEEEPAAESPAKDEKAA